MKMTPQTRENLKLVRTVIVVLFFGSLLLSTWLGYAINALLLGAAVVLEVMIGRNVED